VSVTPVLGILVAIGCGLALVAVAIIVALRIRPSVYASTAVPVNAGEVRTNRKGSSASFGGGAVLRRASTTGGHELIGLESKGPDLLPRSKGEREVFSSKWCRQKSFPHLICSLTLAIGRSRWCAGKKKSFDLSFFPRAELLEEEEAFLSYHERLNGLPAAGANAGGSVTLARRRPDDEDAERRRRLKTNFSRLVRRKETIWLRF